MNWDDFRIFSAAADAGSFTEAARALKLSIATVSRRVGALEHELGLRLFDRSPDGIALTTHGRALLARAAPATEAMADTDRLAAVLRGGGWPEPIRVTATEAVIAEILAPALPRLFDMLPDLHITLTSDASLVSVAARKTDIAIRMSRPTGNGLLVKRLASLTLGLYAAPGYLAGRNAGDLDLRSARLLGYDDSFGPIPEVLWFRKNGLDAAVAVRMSSARAMIEAAKAGAGIALLPDMLARRHTDLVPVPADCRDLTREAWIVSHRDFRDVDVFKQVRRWTADAFGAGAGLSGSEER